VFSCILSDYNACEINKDQAGNVLLKLRSFIFYALIWLFALSLLGVQNLIPHWLVIVIALIISFIQLQNKKQPVHPNNE